MNIVTIRPDIIVLGQKESKNKAAGRELLNRDVVYGTLYVVLYHSSNSAGANVTVQNLRGQIK